MHGNFWTCVCQILIYREDVELITKTPSLSIGCECESRHDEPHMACRGIAEHGETFVRMKDAALEEEHQHLHMAKPKVLSINTLGKKKRTMDHQDLSLLSLIF